MRRHLLALALVVGLLATAAGALAMPITFEVAGTLDSTLRAQVTADYSAASGLATFSIWNTTATQGAVTGFAFSLPQNGAGLTDVSLVGTSNANFHVLAGGIAPNGINVPQYSQMFDAGLGTGPNFNGGKPAKGIQMGEVATFSLLFSGPGTGSWDMTSILAALGEESGPHFVVRFQATTGGGSDVGTPTPIPGAVWLLGSGLVGLLGFKGRRRSAA